MHLKRLALQGFKTFADPTELDIGAGITAVVGPNGAGKSNIADAIQWVLGEQSLKALRSARSQDIIFAGSAERKPVGLAEVSLTLDNSDSSLHLDFPEITVTRRVYRSGEGEYLINRVPCRLRDIHELFLDTGLGRQAYSVINQTEVDAILSIRPEDRRELLEEAAGINKYRARRREAERKLEHARANLIRVTDIIAELESQLEPMARQSEGARRYQELARDLEDLKLGLFLAQHEQFQSSLTRGREREAELTAALESARTRGHQLVAAEAALRLQLQQKEEELDELRALAGRLANEHERAQGRVALARERIASLSRQSETAGAEAASLEERLAASQRELAESGPAREGLLAREEELRTQLAAQEAAGAEAAAALRAAAENEQSSRESYRVSLDELARRRNELAQCESLWRTAEARLARLRQDDATMGAEQTESEESLGRAREDQVRLREAVARLEAEVESLERAEAEARELIQRRRDEEADRASQLSARRSRCEALEEMARSWEGCGPGARTLLEAAAAGRLPTGVRPVLEILRARQEDEQAVAAALGDLLHGIVVADRAGLEAAARALREIDPPAGLRATLLPRRALAAAARPPAGTATGPTARELVRVEPGDEALADALLARTLVADDLPAALELAEKAADWDRIVTRSGDAVDRSGAVTLAAGAAGAPLLGRAREIESLHNDIAKLEGQQAEVARGRAAAEQAAAIASERLVTARAELTEVRAGDAERGRELELLEQEFARRKERQAALAAEIEILAAEAAETSRDRDGLAGAVAAAEANQRAQETALAEAEQARIRAQEHREAAVTALADLRLALSAEEGERHSVEAGAEKTAQAQEAWRGQIEAKRTMQAELAASLQTETGKRGETEASLAALAEARSRAEADLEVAKTARTQILEAISADLEQARVGREQGDDLQDKIHRNQVRLAQLESELGFVERNLFEDYRLTVDQARQRRQPVADRRGVEARVKEIQAEIESLGTVNLGAVEEYDRLQQRLQHLTAQRADLEAARDDIHKVIAEIDETAATKFLECFEAVKREFQDIFRRLFDGGETELLLTDPDHVLESGIDVNVTVPGKRHQNLLLLSGGERALTALAFLLALLRVRPSPFVLLDEVDAPLDDSNVNRYADVLREFAQRSQFIVITHNKGTMEAADVLYGVTMEQAGVSKLISMRLQGEAPAAQTAEAT